MNVTIRRSWENQKQGGEENGTNRKQKKIPQRREAKEERPTPYGFGHESKQKSETQSAQKDIKTQKNIKGRGRGNRPPYLSHKTEKKGETKMIYKIIENGIETYKGESANKELIVKLIGKYGHADIIPSKEGVNIEFRGKIRRDINEKEI